MIDEIGIIAGGVCAFFLLLFVLIVFVIVPIENMENRHVCTNLEENGYEIKYMKVMLVNECYVKINNMFVPYERFVNVQT